MPLSEREVLDVLDLFQKSGWEELHLQSGDLSLSISKSGVRPAAPATTGAPRVAPSGTIHASTSAASQAVTAAVAAQAITVDPRWIAVRAPMLGTFYAASKPGAPPFVTVGQKVGADDNIGIVEVMKLMNYVKAGSAGRVAHIAAVNGELVEFDEALIYLDPEVQA